MELAGLTNVPSVVVKPPRVGEAAIQLECEVYFYLL
jgi:flavin reductase (DIM6/NTAB) family NADH-FMN oxidoreductase RutF